MMDDEKYEIYFQKGFKYVKVDDFKNKWDIEVIELTFHPDGNPWVKHLTMKNDSGQWIEDGSYAYGFAKDIEIGKEIRVKEDTP